MIKAILALILTVSVFCSCQTFKTPEIREPHVLTVHVLRWVNNNQPVIRIESSCYNPNPVGFNFQGGQLDLYLDSFYLGHTIVDTNISVAPHSYFMVPIQLQLNLVRMLGNGMDLAKEDTIKVQGSMVGTALGITETRKIQYKGVHKIQLEMKPF